MNRQAGQMVVLVVVLLVFGAAARVSAADQTVLLVIDIQDFYFAGGSMPLVGSSEAAGNAARVLERFRALGWPVVHVQHLPGDRAEPGQDVEPVIFRINAAVVPQAGETVIGKHYANAFRDTRLLAVLQQLQARRLIIVGMQTQMCVEAATRAAADLGYTVTVVGDACATRPLEYGGVTVSAAQVHAATLASLEGSYATITTSDELLAELPTPESPPQAAAAAAGGATP